jgi:beta-lactamase regulating signal transducer with metallopeptidase domain
VNEALFTLVLALAWFGAVNAALSAAVAGIGWLIERGLSRRRASNTPTVLFLLNLAPGVGALFFTCIVFLPAHYRFEPKNAEESAGYTLVALGVLGAVTLVLAARRAVRDAGATRRVERGWRQRARGPRTLAGGRLPVYGLSDPRPIISLAGLVRPRVFVARPIVEAFTADEMEVSLAHELAHHDAHDNLKRMLVACSPDLLGIWPSGRALERRWREAVEFAADARAVAGREDRAVSLASALIKVARLSPAAVATGTSSAFYDGTLLSARIDRLLSLRLGAAPPHRLTPAAEVFLGSATLFAALLAAEAAWFGVHLVTEGLVRFLP